MFQSFDTSSSPEKSPERLAALRKQLDHLGVDGFLVPRADVHQGEYVAPRDERLAWVTGFTGSAGFAAVLKDRTGLFVDGRYRVQARQQCVTEITPVPWPEVSLAQWLTEALPNGGKVAFDPWLHSLSQVDQLTQALTPRGITLTASTNLVDAIWEDQPTAPTAPAIAHPIEFSGETSASKRARLGEMIAKLGATAAVITLPDSLCWLLNIRGSDIAHNPVMHGFAILHADGRCDLIADLAKTETIKAHFEVDVTLHAPQNLVPLLQGLDGPALIDKTSVPMAIASLLAGSDVDVIYGQDPCALPKACKSEVELKGAAAAHIRDGAAMVSFLAWFDANASKGISEIDVVRELEARRAATGGLRDISFDTIAGSGPNGAVIHYRVTHDTDRKLGAGEIMVLDSGGQYQDGTTDITRTLPIGEVGQQEKQCFTRVLKGLIAMSELRWPKGLAGRDIQAISRVPLWAAGLDYDHGLGHGVGSYLSVHEGPQSLSSKGNVVLEPGMIVSIEPGYYREGAFGIRIENLAVIEKAPDLPEQDVQREMLHFRTLTLVPIDIRLIDADMLSPDEIAWVNSYHKGCLDMLGSHVSARDKDWLKAATRPL